MGAHSCELYCNLGLCCLYGGQLDLVLPCFQRALRLAISADQRADVWYNLSFVAMVRKIITSHCGNGIKFPFEILYFLSTSIVEEERHARNQYLRKIL